MAMAAKSRSNRPAANLLNEQQKDFSVNYQDFAAPAYDEGQF